LDLAGKRIILGVCGGIAAYKAILVLRLLQQAGAEIQVIMTEHAAKFIGELTFATLSQKPVLSDLWDQQAKWSQHVQLAETADLILIVPATAQTIFKLAHGVCDNLLTAVCLSARQPIWLAPAMDLQMYQHPQVKANLERLSSFNYHIIEPESGYLASGLIGTGRLAEPETIVNQIIKHFTHGYTQTFKDKKVLITAGPTREALDPVRYISNHSTGKMGLALAAVAQSKGAAVTLVCGPISLPYPENVTVIEVITAQQMFDAVAANADCQDIFIMSAAVCDYAPEKVSPVKLKKKEDEDFLQLKLKKTPDILAWLGEHKKTTQFLVGFALETNDALHHAKEKLQRKRADMIVLNSPDARGSGFGYDTNEITILDKNGQVLRYPLAAKTAVATYIWTAIEKALLLI
jgi:phosphopantothenoylcysteine decarboxylase/phosphopantothenate--cysteine ligase